MKKQSGFTLVEFTVAMAVTLIALAATMLAFRDATRANQNVTFRTDMTDNLRAALNLVEKDLIQTGTGIPTGGITVPTFTGGSCPVPVTSPPTSPTYSNVKRPLFTGTTTFPICNTYLPSIEPGNALGPFITSPDATSTVNTDIISILYVDNATTTSPYLVGLDAQPINGSSCPAGSIASNTTSITFDSNCINLSNLAAAGASMNPGDLIMFSNASGNAIQTVTSINNQTLNFASGDAFGFNGTNAPAGTLVQLQNYTTDSSGNKVYNGTYPPTTATRVWMITYFLDNTTDPYHVRLIRVVNFNRDASTGKLGEPVAETLENLQFTFNFNDGKMANQITVPTNYTENQIRSVNVYLGARSTNKTGGNNKYIRQNFQTQVSLRSMAYVNQYVGQ